MTYGLDTSVILRLIVDADNEHSKRVRDRIVELRNDGDDFFISNLAVNEAYFALQHHYGATKAEAITALHALAAADGFAITAEARAALETPEVWQANPGFIDRILASEYAARGYVTVSCEKSFRRLDLAEVIG